MVPALAALLALTACAQEFSEGAIKAGVAEWRGRAAAYVRKVAARPSSRATGIRAQGRLPVFLEDASRRPLDRPSVYLGAGGAGLEVDAGLTWDLVYAPGRSGFAFRPFWRVDDATGNHWHNPPKDSRDNMYFEPGEAITMTFQRSGQGRFRLDVRADDEPGRHFTTFIEVKAPTDRLAFKRVNAIDQSGLEGRPAAPTRAAALGARWESTSLLGPRGVYGPGESFAPAERIDIDPGD